MTKTKKNCDSQLRVRSSNRAQSGEPCLLCAQTKEPQIGKIFDRPELVNLIRKVLGIPLVRDISLPETICCNCIMRINCCLEFQRCIVRNMLNHRIRYYYNIGDRANVLKYQTECKSFQTKCMTLPSGVSESFFNDSSLTRLLRNPTVQKSAAFLPDRIVNNDTAGLIISDVRTEELPQEPDSTGDEIDEMDVQPHTSDYGETSTTSGVELLEPMFQTSEHAHETESGGNIHAQNEVLSARRKQTEPISYQCQYCNKVYRQANAWRKHTRTHQVTDQRKPISQKPKHKCPDCNQEFESLTVLRKHSIVHEKRFICKTCGELFRIQHDYTWHTVCCEAKSTALEASDEPRRRTRSQGRPSVLGSMVRRSNGARANALNDAASSTSRCSVDSTRADSMYNERIEVVKLWTKQLEIGDKPDPKDLTSNNVRDDDCVSVLSDISSMTRISDVSSSTASSSMSISSILSSGRTPSDSTSWAQEQKRRKLHKAGKRRAKQRGKEYYACSFRHSCSFGSTSLSKTMYHEVKVHNALLLHNCVECNEWFTNKENLIRHKKRHRPQLHICINCNYKFDNKYELEHHTLLHAEKSFNCAYCEMSFLKRAELGRHINGFHQSDVIQKYGIIDRIAAVGKSHDSPYLRKPNNFNGYKSKELIQHAPSPDDKTTPNHTIDKNRKPQSKWSVYSVSSSCYSHAITHNSRHVDNDDGYEDDDNCVLIDEDTQDPGNCNGNGSILRRSLPPGPLECFNVFSVDSLGMDDALGDETPTLPKLLAPLLMPTAQTPNEHIQNGNGLDIVDGNQLQLPQRKNNRNLIALPIDFFDKYIPPYDELFEKYLTNRKFNNENEMVTATTAQTKRKHYLRASPVPGTAIAENIDSTCAKNVYIRYN